MKPLFLGLAIALSCIASNAAAQPPAPARVPITFKAGESSATIKGAVADDQDVNYTLRAKAGQDMTVTLTSANTSLNFNVTPAGSQDAIFIGSMSGTTFEGTLPKDGEYVINVYLMRSSARRGSKAGYTLSVGIDAPGNAPAPRE
jgi:hypothetical protein